MLYITLHIRVCFERVFSSYFQPEFVSSLFQFASSLNTLGLNDTELGLFSAIVLLTADRPGVTDLKTIEHHQDRLIDALKVQVSGIAFSYTALYVSVK